MIAAEFGYFIYLIITIIGAALLLLGFEKYARKIFVLTTAFGFCGLLLTFSPTTVIQSLSSDYVLYMRINTFTSHITAFIGSVVLLFISYRRRFPHDGFLYLMVALGLLVVNALVALVGNTTIMGEVWNIVPGDSFATTLLKFCVSGMILLIALHREFFDRIKNRDSVIAGSLGLAMLILFTIFSFKIQTDEFAILENSQYTFQSTFRQSVKESLDMQVKPLKFLLQIKEEASSKPYERSVDAARSVLATDEPFLSLTLFNLKLDPVWAVKKADVKSSDASLVAAIREYRNELDAGEIILSSTRSLERRGQIEIVLPYFRRGLISSYLVAILDFEKVIQRVEKNFLDPDFAYQLATVDGDTLIDHKDRNPYPWFTKKVKFEYYKKQFVLTTFPHFSGALSLVSVLPKVSLLLIFALSIFLAQLAYLYRKMVVSYDEIEQLVHARTQELEEAKVKAEVANDAKTQFLANVSHEIRTPLNVVMGVVDLLEDTSLSVAQKKYTNMLKLSGNNLLRLVNDILDLSKIESGQVVLEEASFNLQNLVEEITELFKIKAMEKGLKVSLNVDGLSHKQYMGDSHRIKQIITNLLANAVKFTDNGEVSLTVANEDENVVLRVTDTGIGIPSDRISQVFERFMQVDSSTTRRRTGAGLGLSIVSKIVEMMKGNISARSELGKGSEFCVTLPLRQVQEVEIPLKDLVALKAENKVGQVPLRILVTDDASENRELIKLFLKKTEYSITEAENGEVALNKFKKERFDLLLMDMQMPVMDGYTATQKIREHELATKMQKTMIVALTAHALKEDREKCTRVGCDEYLAKPISKKDLLELLNRVELVVQAKPVHQEIGQASGEKSAT